MNTPSSVPVMPRICTPYLTCTAQPTGRASTRKQLSARGKGILLVVVPGAVVLLRLLESSEAVVTEVGPDVLVENHMPTASRATHESKTELPHTYRSSSYSSRWMTEMGTEVDVAGEGLQVQ